MKSFLFIFFPLLLVTLTIAQFVEAQELTSYTPLVTLPKLGEVKEGGYTAEDYVRVLYILSISVAGILAMVKIIFAGVKYMLTDVVVSKGDAKKDIMGALLGLLIVLGAVLILNTINPQITTLSLFSNGPSVGIVGTGKQESINPNQSTNKNISNLNKNCKEGEVAQSTKQGGPVVCVSKTKAVENTSVADDGSFDFESIILDEATRIDFTESGLAAQGITLDELAGQLIIPHSQKPDILEANPESEGIFELYEQNVIEPKCSGTVKKVNKFTSTTYYCLKE